jgi:V/A-type H+-transporting ATPase subunit D
MRLQHRLSSARLARDLLEEKLQILVGVLQRFSERARGTGQDFEEADREARTWVLRAALLSGERAVSAQAPQDAVAVEIHWGATMGVRYPARVGCRFPAPAPSAPAADSAALVLAQAACRRVVEAAVEHAAAQAASHALDVEVSLTRRRLRALEQRWLPQLQSALAALELRLDEGERDELVRYRWAAGHTGTRPAAGP